MSLRLLVPLLSLCSLLGSAPAAAWLIEDPLHVNCHERLSQAALTAAGYTGTPPEPTEEDRLLVNSVDFSLEQYDDNPWAWALILGARYPDLHGAPSFDFDDLSRVHNALADQSEHCLRSELQDGAAGTEEAVVACRNFIASMYWEAVGAVDATGNVDPNAQTSAAVNFVYSGRVGWPVSQYYFAAGRALHAIQDGFTHTYRDPNNWGVIQTVFNWSDQVSCTLDEETDGHGHEGVLDDCDGEWASKDARFEATGEASADFLAILKEPGDHVTREQRLQDFLDEWFVFQPGCELSNDYCDNPDQAALVSSPESDIAICDGCSSTSSRPLAHAWWIFLGLGLLGWRRAPRAAVLGGVLLLGAPALAQGTPVSPPATDPGAAPTDAAPASAPEATPPDAAASPAASASASPVASTAAVPAPAAETPAAAPATSSPKRSGYRTELRSSVSVQNPALAIGVGAGWRWTRFDVGAFAELNPWFSFERSRLHLGSTNVGAFLHYLHPISDNAELRFGVGGGAAILNESLAGSPAGKIGPYLNLRLLGFAYHWEDIAFTVDGFDLALPVPQMVGWPVLHAQHRMSVGVQF